MVVVNFAPQLQTFSHGSNGSISVDDSGERLELSLVDDLKVSNLLIDSVKREMTLECRSSARKVSLVFSGISSVGIKQEDTYGKYGAHNESVDLSIIDQIIYDPDLCTEMMPVTIVGLGWACAFTAEEAKVVIVEKDPT